MARSAAIVGVADCGPVMRSNLLSYGFLEEHVPQGFLGRYSAGTGTSYARNGALEPCYQLLCGLTAKTLTLTPPGTFLKMQSTRNRRSSTFCSALAAPA